MNKAVITILLILIFMFSVGKISSFANEGNDVNKLNINSATRIDEDSNIFQISGEGKDKTQFRIKDSRNDENKNSEFMIKGIITASASGSIVIDNKTINIDSSVTGNVKIVGTISVGSYAMAKGEIIDSKYYAQKIVVDQRNKKDLKDRDNDKNDDEIATTSASPTPTLSLTPTPVSRQSGTEDDSHDKNLDLGRLIETIQNFLNYLRDLALKI